MFTLMQTRTQVRPRVAQTSLHNSTETTRMRKLVILPGDGIGPEITEQVLRIFEKVKAPFEYIEKQAGMTALERHGSLLPDDTVEAISNIGLALCLYIRARHYAEICHRATFSASVRNDTLSLKNAYRTTADPLIGQALSHSVTRSI